MRATKNYDDDVIYTEKTSKEFKSIQLKNNSLVIDFATETDEGYYMCQASNGIGTGLKKIIHINVNGENICIRINVFIIYIHKGAVSHTPIYGM